MKTLIYLNKNQNMLKPQSIRKGMVISINGKQVEKQAVLDLSKEWSPNQENLFRKTLKQGGEVTIKGNLIKVTTEHPVLNSKGEKDGGKIIYPSIDMRF